MTQKQLVRRLKSLATVSNDSLIEVFERGLRKDYEDRGFRYQEVVLGSHDVMALLTFASIAEASVLPKCLAPESSGAKVICSVSQRLIELLPALVVARNKHQLNLSIEVYVNSLPPVLAPLKISLPLMSAGDQVIVNTPFTKSCISQVIDINTESVIVRPPIPELCTDRHYNRAGQSTKKKITTFNRVIADKGCHEVIKAMKLLDDDWELYIYGFHRTPTLYEQYLFRLIRILGLKKRVHCMPILLSINDRIDALTEADVVVNVSVSFEETMGKVILEALSWNKPVIANYWSGFPDLLPNEHLVPTHWSCHDWFHLRANDLAAAIQKSISAPKNYPRDLYLKFFSNREKALRNNGASSSPNPMKAPSLPDWKALHDWIVMPRLMSSRSNADILIKNSRILGRCFAHARVATNHEICSLELQICHPRILFIDCLAKQQDPDPSLESWVERCPESPYLEIAKSMLATP